MNKKVLLGVMVAIIIVAVVVGFLMSGKGNTAKNLEEVTISNVVDYNEETITATIGYPKGAGITVENGYDENTKIFQNEQGNWEVGISLLADTTYDDNKEYASNEEGYKEVTFNGFKGYIYEYSENEIDGAILLGDGEKDNVYKYLEISVKPINYYVDGEEMKAKPIYELKDVQTILNSIKFGGFKGEPLSEEKEQSKNTMKNYGEFASRTDGISDKDGLIFIPSYTSPNETLYRAEQRNDNVGIDNYLWYISDESSYSSSGIEVRIFPKSGAFANMEEYIKKKGDMYNWSKQVVAGKEYNTYTFGSDPSTPAKYSKYYSGAFMVGNRVVEFSYNMYAEIPDQDLGDTFFNQIIDSIVYSEDFK